jgi:hypothetical protein
MPVKVTMKPNWDGKIEDSIKDGLLEMATDIHRRATAFAPVDTSALRNSGRVEPILGGFAIRFGDSRVPYARIRHEINYKNPQTRGYLARAGDAVARGNVAKYFTRKIV